MEKHPARCMLSQQTGWYCRLERISTLSKNTEFPDMNFTVRNSAWDCRTDWLNRSRVVPLSGKRPASSAESPREP